MRFQLFVMGVALLAACSDKASETTRDAGNASADLPVVVDACASCEDMPIDASGAGDAGAASDAGGPICVPNGVCGSGCTYAVDPDCPPCDGTNGMVVPMRTCSPEFPCENLLASYTMSSITDPPLSQIDFPTFEPDCATTERGLDAGRPAFDDGAPIEWTDADGVTRYHCEYRPPGTSADSKRPLLLVVHGSGGYAHSLYDTMSWRSKAETADLSGDAQTPGFIVVAPQGRNLHWITASDQDGSKHDTFFRDLGSPSENRDIAYYDHIVDSLVGEGVVDPNRIYITGWSNGARFAAMYAIARHETSTPGGNRVAAVANYSGGDPFSNGYHGQTPSCQQATYPTSDVPLLLYSRACDAVACDAAQDQDFRDGGTETSPGNIAEDWITTMRDVVGSPAVDWHILTGFGGETDRCTGPLLCGIAGALVNHVRWPDGIGDNSGNDYEPQMLEFLREHPLAP